MSFWIDPFRQQTATHTQRRKELRTSHNKKVLNCLHFERVINPTPGSYQSAPYLRNFGRSRIVTRKPPKCRVECGTCRAVPPVLAFCRCASVICQRSTPFIVRPPK